ncbi:glycosyltransferase family 4 protein [Lottiidibacillus patelloidae]|nr:glycosyltransferase family 4 protein [Lottiidibacillus patelloidae]
MQQNKTRVLFLVNIPAPYRVDFFNELGKLCDLTVLFESGESIEREQSWLSNNFINFKAIFLKGIKIKNSTLSFDVIKYLKKNLFDIIVIGGYSTPTGMLAIEVLKLKKIPFILNSDGGILSNESNIKFMIKKHFISSASYWLSTGKKTNEYLVNYGADEGNIYIYPFTSLSEKDLLKSTLDKLTKKKYKENLSIDYDKCILSVGQVIHRKGFDVLLNSISRIPKEIGVYIIGGIPPEEYLKIVHELSLSNVHFLSFKSKNELKKYYMASDLFVLPTREDIWGLVINEAMAHGLPVITTDKCNAGLELVKDFDNGYLVQVDNSDTLANKIEKILYDDIVSERMAIRSLKKIRRFTIENMAIETNKIFETILKKRDNNGKYK